MKLIDRYVAEVGRQLPEKNRADIEKELRSTLEDMLEDASHAAGRPADEEMEAEVLKTYGKPNKVAASYLPEKYLIGPRLYPFFMMVLRIVLTVVSVVTLLRIGMAMAYNADAAGIFTLIGQFILEWLTSCTAALGNIVLVFAIIERFVPGVNEQSAEVMADLEGRNDEKWDPRDLPEAADDNRFSLGEAIFDILFTVAALLILNFYPQIIGIGFISDGKWTYLPVLSDAFRAYLPWITLLWSAQVIKNLVLLRLGRWNTPMRWVGLGIDVANIALTYIILRGPSIVGITPAGLETTGMVSGAVAQTLVTLANSGVTIGLAIALVVQIIQVGMKAYHFIKK